MSAVLDAGSGDRAAAWLGKYGPFLLVGAVVLFLILRSRGGRAGAAVASDMSSRGTAMDQIAVQDAANEAAFNRSVRSLRLNEQQVQSNLTLAASKIYQQQIEAEGALNKKYNDYLMKVTPKCPRGTAHTDPQTGAVYCREKTGRGFFAQIGDIALSGLDTATQYYASGGNPRVGRRARRGGGTPPIVDSGGTPMFLPGGRA